MKHLGLIPILLCLVLATLTGTAVWVGRAMPALPSDGLQTVGLDVCQGKLCLYQITPGVTTWTEAKQILSPHITRDEGDHFHGRVDAFELRVEMDMSGTRIRRIDAQSSPNSQAPSALRFKQIIDQYGMPCSVVDVSTRGNGVVAVYPAFRVTVLADQDRIGLNSPISGITLQNDGDLDAANRSCNTTYGASPWRGFASLQVYQGLTQRDFSQRGMNYQYP